MINLKPSRKNGPCVYYYRDIIMEALKRTLLVTELFYCAEHEPSIEKLFCYGLIRANLYYKSPLIRKKGVFRFMPSSIPRNWVNNPCTPRLFLLSTNQYTHLLETLELVFTPLILNDDDGIDLVFKDGTWFASKNWFDQEFAKDMEANS